MYKQLHTSYFLFADLLFPNTFIQSYLPVDLRLNSLSENKPICFSFNQSQSQQTTAEAASRSFFEYTKGRSWLDLARRSLAASDRLLTKLSPRLFRASTSMRTGKTSIVGELIGDFNQGRPFSPRYVELNVIQTILCPHKQIFTECCIHIAHWDDLHYGDTFDKGMFLIKG